LLSRIQKLDATGIVHAATSQLKSWRRKKLLYGRREKLLRLHGALQSKEVRGQKGKALLILNTNHELAFPAELLKSLIKSFLVTQPIGPKSADVAYADGILARILRRSFTQPYLQKTRTLKFFRKLLGGTKEAFELI
jgi:hypothetical protein